MRNSDFLDNSDLGTKNYKDPDGIRPLMSHFHLPSQSRSRSRVVDAHLANR